MIETRILRMGGFAILGASQLLPVCQAATPPRAAITSSTTNAPADNSPSTNSNSPAPRPGEQTGGTTETPQTEAPIAKVTQAEDATQAKLDQGKHTSPASPLTEESLLMRGRRMLPLEVRGDTLVGRTPQGSGAPFLIMSGSETLWQGGPDTAFSISAKGLRHLYLFSSEADNTDWQQLSWQGAPPEALPAAKKPLVIAAADHGVHPGTHDCSPALRQLLSEARRLRQDTGRAVTIRLEPGEYHFYPGGTLPMSIYISNHDQQDIQPVALPLIDLDHVSIDGQGSTLICHGRLLPVLIMDSQHLRLSNLSIDYITPFYTEATITAIDSTGTTVSIPADMAWSIKNGRFLNCGENWEMGITCAIAFKPDGRMVPLGTGGDLPWSRQADITGPNQVHFPLNAGKLGLSVGDIVTLRSFWRPHPAMVLYRTRDTLLDQVIFRNSQGMALLAQRSEDITIRGGGCIRHKGRLHTVSADATHFSNCRGHIDVEGALYEGMMDDAINVHSTCLRIEEVISPREILCRYVHPQAIGFEVILPGENLQFIHAPTLQNTPTLSKAAHVTKVDERTLRITLAEDLPEGIGEGDAVENADWYPQVTFRHNTVRHNRARGALFTTPRPVLVEKNQFIWSSGSAILLAGDAQGWYESGRCLDVVIRDNIFENNLTCRFQFTEGIISIYPEVSEPKHQTERYHQNILIENNTFITHRVPLVFASSTRGLTFRHNTVHYHDQYKPLHGGVPFIFRHCEQTTTQELPSDQQESP